MGTCFSKSSPSGGGMFAGTAPVSDENEVRRNAIKEAIPALGQYTKGDGDKPVFDYFHREDLGPVPESGGCSTNEHCALRIVYMQVAQGDSPESSPEVCAKNLDALIKKLEDLPNHPRLPHHGDMAEIARTLLPRLQAERALYPSAEERPAFRV